MTIRRLLPVTVVFVLLVTSAITVVSGGNYNRSSATLTAYALVTDQMGRFSYWSADGNAVDSISGHNGILENGATFAPGIKGQAFYLDGVDDVVRIPYSPDFDFPSDASMSVSLWAYRAGTASTMHLVGKRGCAGDGNYQMAFDGSGIGFGAPGTGATDPGGLPMQTWVHLVGTYDGSATRLYMNGQTVASLSGGWGGINTDGLLIGGSGCFERFAGLIDEISFYNHALSPSEILSIYDGGSGENPSPMILGQATRLDGNGGGLGNVTVNLTGSATRSTTTTANGWYTFGNLTAGGSYTVTVSRSGYVFSPSSQSMNNLAGEQYANFSATFQPPPPTGSACVTTPSDAVACYPGDGNTNDIIAGHNGVLAWYNHGDGYWYPGDGQNGATFAPGIVGPAFSFDGVSSFVQVPDGSAGAFGSAPFTVALWAKFNGADCPEGLPCEDTFIASDSSGWVFWRDEIALHFSRICCAGEKPPLVSFPWSPQPGQWYHLAVMRDGDTFTLYINGLDVSSTTHNATYRFAELGSAVPLTIGQWEGTAFFNGLLDEIGIYNRALSTAEIQSIFNAGSYGQCKTASFTGSGQNVVVQTTGADLTFSQVTTTGTSSVVPIDPATVGQVPGGFAVSSSVAYDISTTAAFSGPVTLAFKAPGPISQTDFNNLAILHNVNGTLVDVTATTPARDYSTLTIYATTNSFSPFYLARRGPHINTLFDQTKAYKSGSTVPIKLQALDANNSNVSSLSTSLVARDLRLMSGNTTAPVVDSGNANPDSTFRYDSALGGSGGGYIFNLSTRGLASGQYVLSFYIGNDRSFFYTVKFEVK